MTSSDISIAMEFFEGFFQAWNSIVLCYVSAFFPHLVKRCTVGVLDSADYLTEEM